MPRVTATLALLMLSLLLAAAATLICLSRPRDIAQETLMEQARHYTKLIGVVMPNIKHQNRRYYKEVAAMVEQEYALLQELARVYAISRGLEGPEVHVHDLWGWSVTVILNKDLKESRD